MIDTELSKKNLFERTNKNNKTIIIDNFISKDKFLSIKNSSLEKLNGGNSPDYVWYYLNEEHDFSELCVYLINCVSNYYDLTPCVGYEFWTQNNTRPKGWHYDKDEQLKNNVGKFRFPICSIVYYINVQNLIGGRLHLHEDTITPKENRLVIFPPATYHFVEDFEGERTSLLVNPWSKKVHDQQIPTYPKWRKQ